MLVRSAVREFLDKGPLPSEEAADEKTAATLTELLHKITAPITTEEAKLLMLAFGPDECFGLAWTLVHLIETAPSCPLRQEPDIHANQWIRCLWDRWQRSASGA